MGVLPSREKAAPESFGPTGSAARARAAATSQITRGTWQIVVLDFFAVLHHGLPSKSDIPIATLLPTASVRRRA